MNSNKKTRSGLPFRVLLTVCIVLAFCVGAYASGGTFTRQPNSVSVSPGQTSTVNFAAEFESTADWKCYLDKKSGDGSWKTDSQIDSLTSRDFPYEASKAGDTYTYRIYMSRGTQAFSSNEFTVSYEIPEFTEQPASASVKPGQTATITFRTDLTDTTGLNYRLEEKTDSGSWTSLGSPGGSFTSWQISYDNSKAGKIKTYRVKIYKSGSSPEMAIYSDEFRITYEMPEFTKQPDNISVKVDQTVSTSFMTDLPADSDWRVSLQERSASGLWEDVSCGTGSLTSWQFPYLSSAKGETRTYRVKIVTYSGNAAIYSDKFKVSFPLPVFTRQPSDITVHPGQTENVLYSTDIINTTGWTCKLYEKTSDGGWRDARIPGGTLTSWPIPYNEFNAGITNTYQLYFNKTNIEFYSNEFTITHAGLEFKTEPANLTGRTGDTVYANFELEYSDSNTKYMLQEQVSGGSWVSRGIYNSTSIPITVEAETKTYRIKAYREGYSGDDAYSSVFTVSMGEYMPEFTTSIVGGVVSKDREIIWNIDWKGNPASKLSLECKDSSTGEFTRVCGISSDSTSYTIKYTADKYNRRKTYRLLLDDYGVYSNSFTFSYIDPGFTPKLTSCTADYAIPLTINFDTGLTFENGWSGIKVYEKKDDGVWSDYGNVSWPYTSYTFSYYTSYAGKTYNYKLAILGDTDGDGNAEEFSSDEFSISYAPAKFSVQPADQTGEVDEWTSVSFELESKFSGYTTRFCLEEFYDGEWHTTESSISSPKRIKVQNTVRKFRIAVMTSNSDLITYSNEFTAAPIPTATASITAPVAGQYPSFTAIPGDSSKYSIKSVIWNVEEDGQWTAHTSPDFFFEAGKLYQVLIEFEPAEGVTLNWNGNFTINGNDTWTGANGRIRGYTFTVGGTATKLPAPTGVQWKETIAKQGKTTAAWDAVACTDHYRIILYRNGTDTGLTLETSAAELDLADKMTEKGPGSYSFKVVAVGSGAAFTESDPSDVSTVLSYAAASIAAPAIGETPSLIARSGEAEKYTAEVLKWYVKEDGDWYDYTRPDYVFRAGKEYMVEIRFSAATGNTLDPNGFYTINGNPGEWTTDGLTRSYSFTICGVTINSSGAHASRDTSSGSENQSDISGAIDEVIYTADTGYYFPEDYSFTQSGITVFRDSYTQITVKGRPTASTTIILPSAVKADPIVITTQPQTVNLQTCTDKASFTVTLESDAPCDSYNWQIYAGPYGWFDMDTLIETGSLSATGQHTKTVTIDVARSDADLCSTRMRCVITRAGETTATDGALLKVEHRFDEYSQNNETSHKLICSVCGLEKEEAHLKQWICDVEATEDTSGTKHFECQLCGYVSEPESYTLSAEAENGILQFYKNDGTTETGAFRIFMEKENTEKQIPSWTLTRQGYVFEGWALTADAEEALWRPGDSILIASGTTTLYGVWKTSEVTVSGAVTSYNPNNAVSLTLYAPGDRTTALKTAIIDASSGSGQVTQSFSIADVAAGTYDLVITKPGHLVYTISNVVVGNSDLDLTAAAGKEYQTITLLAGDVNGDEKINSDDLNVVWKPSNYLKTPGSAGVENITDVNGDGKINSDDLNIIWKPEHYLKNVTNCIFEY